MSELEVETHTLSQSWPPEQESEVKNSLTYTVSEIIMTLVAVISVIRTLYLLIVSPSHYRLCHGPDCLFSKSQDRGLGLQAHTIVRAPASDANTEKASRVRVRVAGTRYSAFSKSEAKTHTL